MPVWPERKTEKEEASSSKKGGDVEVPVKEELGALPEGGDLRSSMAEPDGGLEGSGSSETSGLGSWGKGRRVLQKKLMLDADLQKKARETRREIREEFQRASLEVFGPLAAEMVRRSGKDPVRFLALADCLGAELRTKEGRARCLDALLVSAGWKEEGSDDAQA